MGRLETKIETIRSYTESMESSKLQGMPINLKKLRKVSSKINNIKCKLSVMRLTKS